MGFDDLEESTSFWPPLTTIRQDFLAVGRLSIEKLLQQIAGNTPGQRRHHGADSSYGAKEHGRASAVAAADRPWATPPGHERLLTRI